LGWLAPEGRDNWFDYDTTPHPTAERFEPGARNFIGAVALDAALAQYEEVGAELVETRVVELRNYAARVLDSAGCELLWNPQPEFRAGIVSFRHPRVESKELFEA
jgi:selenocysteine lyase/cysteine desulfurase